MKLNMLIPLIAGETMLKPGDQTELFSGVDAERLIAWGFAEAAEPEGAPPPDPEQQG